MLSSTQVSLLVLKKYCCYQDHSSSYLITSIHAKLSTSVLAKWGNKWGVIPRRDPWNTILKHWLAKVTALHCLFHVHWENDGLVLCALITHRVISNQTPVMSLTSGWLPSRREIKIKTDFRIEIQHITNSYFLFLFLLSLLVGQQMCVWRERRAWLLNSCSETQMEPEGFYFYQAGEGKHIRYTACAISAAMDPSCKLWICLMEAIVWILNNKTKSSSLLFNPLWEAQLIKAVYYNLIKKPKFYVSYI